MGKINQKTHKTTIYFKAHRYGKRCSSSCLIKKMERQSLPGTITQQPEQQTKNDRKHHLLTRKQLNGESHPQALGSSSRTRFGRLSGNLSRSQTDGNLRPSSITTPYTPENTPRASQHTLEFTHRRHSNSAKCKDHSVCFISIAANLSDFQTMRSTRQRPEMINNNME